MYRNWKLQKYMIFDSWDREGELSQHGLKTPFLRLISTIIYRIEIWKMKDYLKTIELEFKH